MHDETPDFEIRVSKHKFTEHKIAEQILPDWFGPFADSENHPLNNYRGQHKIYQQWAVEAARRVIIFLSF